MQQLAAVEKTLNTPTINELAYRQAIEQRRQLERDLAFADQNKSC